jgi:hypothetical protein
MLTKGYYMNFPTEAGAQRVAARLATWGCTTRIKPTEDGEGWWEIVIATQMVTSENREMLWFLAGLCLPEHGFVSVTY